MQMQSLQYIYISLINTLQCRNELYESTGAKTRMICNLFRLVFQSRFFSPFHVAREQQGSYSCLLIEHFGGKHISWLTEICRRQTRGNHAVSFGWSNKFSLEFKKGTVQLVGREVQIYPPSSFQPCPFFKLASLFNIISWQLTLWGKLGICIFEQS